MSSKMTSQPNAYPGLGLPLRHNPQRGGYGPDFPKTYPVGIHGNCVGSDSDMLPVREVAMMNIMDQLTDKPDWHQKVFDDDIVAKWKREALDIPDEALWKQALADKGVRYWRQGPQVNLINGDDFAGQSLVQPTGIMSGDAFDYCVKELRQKARYYEKSKIVPTLDACASVAKSDALVSPELRDALRDAFDQLKKDQAASPDWHPKTNDMVQDLVHPSMFPLVYGRSKALKEEAVGTTNAIDKFAGKGEVIPKEGEQQPQSGFGHGIGASEVPPEFWSDTYQWLPANVAFKSDNDGSVEFTSYINNLHPVKYANIYRTIEKLIETSLPMWDQCLTIVTGYNEKQGAGRLQSRFCKPDNADDDNEDNWYPLEKTKEDDWEWRYRRKPVQPVPDSPTDRDYSPGKGEKLIDMFKESGLQIIVKLASIELNPDKPEFPAGGWHVEGQMNEHICGTALYYLDSENVTSSNLSFRMLTDGTYMNDNFEEVGQDNYKWMEKIYGTLLGGGNSPGLQNYGSVETPQGRLLAFPNVFQHRVSPFRLQDRTKPGHRRFIALWLVDPHYRIISTANLPPQQQEWWLESVFGRTDESRAAALSKLPAELAQLLQEHTGIGGGLQQSGNMELPLELMNMVRNHFDRDASLLMSLDEAREHREKLMEGRTAFRADADESWHNNTYNFCEH